MGAWEDTFETGGLFEDFCLKDISEKKYPAAFKNTIWEKLSEYDIVLFDGNVSKLDSQKTVECKFDRAAKETGNICIEVGCNGRWSGLLLTKADYWIITDGETLYIIEQEKIWDCIHENDGNGVWKKYKCRVEQERGVTKDMDIYLIPKRIFVKYCCEIGNINEMKYDTL